VAKLLRRRAATPVTPPGSAERLADAAAAEHHSSRRDLLRNPALVGILAREIVSLTGSQMTWVALPWFVLTTTGSAARMSIVLAVEAAAVAVGGLGAGLATRLGARRTMLICDGSRAPLMAAIPLLHIAGLLSFPLLLVLVAGVGVFATPSFASKTALLPDLFPDDEQRLGEANTLLQTANRLTAVLGPPIAGVLIGVFGATAVLFIDAATFVAGFVIVALLVHSPGIPADGHEDHEHAFRAVYRFLRGDPLLRPWSAVLILGDVMWLALFAALPVLVLDRFGDEPAYVGLSFAGFGFGAIVGGVIAFRVIGTVDRILLASVGEIGMALPLWLLLVHASPWLLVGAFAVAGFANGLVNPALHTIVQLRTPRHLLTKLYSTVITATAVLGPVVLVCTGPALDRFGVDPTVAVIVALDTLLVMLFAAAGLRFRAAERLAPV
jgi:MFS family permease